MGPHDMKSSIEEMTMEKQTEKEFQANQKFLKLEREYAEKIVDAINAFHGGKRYGEGYEEGAMWLREKYNTLMHESPGFSAAAWEAKVQLIQKQLQVLRDKRDEEEHGKPD
jgi:hypothetical protein